MANKGLEKQIFNRVISEVHTPSFRLADKAQSDLRHVIRERTRLLSATGTTEIDQEKVNELVKELAAALHKQAPKASKHSDKVVIGSSLLNRILEAIGPVWPFG